MEAMRNSDYVLVPRHALEDFLGCLDFTPDPRMEVYDPSAFLYEFESACRVDLRLRSSTTREHLRHVKRLLNFLDCHPMQATQQEIRRFLEANPAVNAIKAVRVLYGKFLNSDLAKSFKIPQSQPRPIIAPSREQLLECYDNLDDPELEAAFLVLASSGLRRHELMELVWAQIDLENRMILPSTSSNSSIKRQWITFFNEEAKAALTEWYNQWYNHERVFTIHKDTLTKKLKKASDGRITPKVLRSWFSCEMGRLGVPDRYVDAFCGRTPRSILARHYSDYSPEALKKIYDNVGLTVLGERR